MMSKRKIVIITLMAIFLVLPFFYQVSAAETEIDWPASPMGTSIGPDTPFHTFIQYTYEWGVALGGLAVFAMLLWAGIEYLTSAGDPKKMGSAINRIQSSILGLILLLASWLILNTINPELVQLKELPTIWDERGFMGLQMEDPKGTVPPCDFAVIYPDTDFRGGPGGDPVVFKKPEGGSSEAEGDAINSSSKDRLDIQKVEKSELDDHSDFWASARPFIKLTDEELGWIGDENKSDIVNIVRYNEKGEEDPNGQYKEGGVCMLDLFYTTRRWFRSDVCGGRLARIQLPSRDLSESKFRDDAITCAELSRTVPSKYRVAD